MAISHIYTLTSSYKVRQDVHVSQESSHVYWHASISITRVQSSTTCHQESHHLESRSMHSPVKRTTLLPTSQTIELLTSVTWKKINVQPRLLNILLMFTFLSAAHQLLFCCWSMPNGEESRYYRQLKKNNNLSKFLIIKDNFRNFFIAYDNFS